MKVWIGTGSDGSLVDAEAAHVSAFDHGITVGDGVFETMKVRDGQIFLWPWHLERLHHSASVLHIQLPDDAVLAHIVKLVIAENASAFGTAVSRLRLTVTAGVGPLGSARDAVPPTLMCAQSAMPDRSGPASLRSMPWPKNERSPLAGVKSTSYAENVLALAMANSAGDTEALFLNTQGNLCEGAMSNLFVVLDGEVLTPPLSAGVLAGSTRRFVLNLGGDGIVVAERDIDAAGLARASEVFLTSTFADVRPVHAIDGRAIALGPVTAEIARRFASAASDAQWWS